MDMMRTVVEARGEVEAVARVRRQHGLVVTEDLIGQAATLLVDMWSAATAVGPHFGGDTPLTASFASMARDAVATRR